jgi:CheY-like chemotaxis protein
LPPFPAGSAAEYSGNAECRLVKEQACGRIAAPLQKRNTVSHTAQSPSILVVDDEAPIRRLQRFILQRAGYVVTEASSGFEAIAMLAEGRGLDLLIADMEMPNLDGAEMAARIRRSRPDLKILYVTGHIDRLMDMRHLWAGEAFLDKPFSLEGLCEAVSMLLYGTLKRPVIVGEPFTASRQIRVPSQQPGPTISSLEQSALSPGYDLDIPIGLAVRCDFPTSATPIAE